MKKNIKSAPVKRQATIERNTRETGIKVSINLDGSGKSDIDTGIPFMDHMLELFTRHGLFDLQIKATGDLAVDYHHTIEDLGLVLGQAINQAVGDKKSIARYGWCALPMDETLVLLSLDLSGRPYLVYDLPLKSPSILDIDANIFHEFFQALSSRGLFNLHIKLLSGNDTHHILEAVFKGLSKCLDQAVVVDNRINNVLSTKGVL